MLHHIDRPDIISHELYVTFKAQLRRELDRVHHSSLDEGLGLLLRERVTDMLWARHARQLFSMTSRELVTNLDEIRRGRGQ